MLRLYSLQFTHCMHIARAIPLYLALCYLDYKVLNKITDSAKYKL